jgi:Protein of unknown function (DUF4246)
VLVFPNIYQHAIGKFELKDTSKPGVRKILVFFLVDPTARIISTAKVPPQSTSLGDIALRENLVTKLPIEIAEIVLDRLGYQMTLEEARAHRSELMKERSVATDVVTEMIFQRPFDLCEH